MVHREEQTQYELKPQTTPRVRAEGGHVIVTLELVSLQDRADTLYFELVLHPGYAEQLAFSLQEKSRKIPTRGA
jgi:hypothetical protein